MSEDWIGVDLDGTLAVYDGVWLGIHHIGAPIPLMIERVKEWVTNGKKVKIVTARCGDPKAIPHIEMWLNRHGIGGLEITATKDYNMIEIWDDRCIQVEHNTGRLVVDGLAAENAALKAEVERLRGHCSAIRDWCIVALEPPKEKEVTR